MKNIIEIVVLVVLIMVGIKISSIYKKYRNIDIESCLYKAFSVTIIAILNVLWIWLYINILPSIGECFVRFKKLYDSGIILVSVTLFIGLLFRMIINKFFSKVKAYYINIFAVGLIITAVIYNFVLEVGGGIDNKIMMMCFSLLLGKIIWFDSSIEEAFLEIWQMITFRNTKGCSYIYISIIMFMVSTGIIIDLTDSNKKVFLCIILYIELLLVIFIINEQLKKKKRNKDIVKNHVEDKIKPVRRAVIIFEKLEKLLEKKRGVLLINNEYIVEIIMKEIYEAGINEIYILNDDKKLDKDIVDRILLIADEVSSNIDINFVSLKEFMKSIKKESEHEPAAIIDACQLIDCEEGKVLKKLTDFYNDKANYDKKSIVAIGKDNDEVIGRYIINPKKLRLLRDSIKKGDTYSKLKELLKDCSKEEEMIMLKVEGTRYNVANKLGFLKATIGYALKNESTKDELSKYLNSL